LQSRGTQQWGNSEYDGKDFHGFIFHIIGFCSISDLHTTNDTLAVHGPFVPSPVTQVCNLLPHERDRFAIGGPLDRPHAHTPAHGAHPAG
jgi:hypothetical protein